MVSGGWVPLRLGPALERFRQNESEASAGFVLQSFYPGDQSLLSCRRLSQVSPEQVVPPGKYLTKIPRLLSRLLRVMNPVKPGGEDYGPQHLLRPIRKRSIRMLEEVHGD